MWFTRIELTFVVFDVILLFLVFIALTLPTPTCLPIQRVCGYNNGRRIHRCVCGKKTVMAGVIVLHVPVSAVCVVTTVAAATPPKRRAPF